MSLADTVIRLRGARGWGQRELARISGLAQSTIAHIEKGRRVKGSPDTLRQLARAFGITVDELQALADGEEATGPTASLASLIRELREERGWSVEELARRVGFDPADVAAIESAVNTNPSRKFLERVASAFVMPVADLIRRAGLRTELTRDVEDVVGSRDFRRLANSWPYLTEIERFGVLAQVEALARRHQEEAEQAAGDAPEPIEYVAQFPTKPKIANGK